MVDYTVPQEFVLGGFKTVPQDVYLEQVLNLKREESITIPGDDIANALKRIWQTGRYSAVTCEIEKVVGKYVFLIFNLEGLPRLSSWKYPGLKKGASDDLDEKINLQKNTALTEHEKERIQYVIKKHYAEKGFMFAETELATKAIDTLPTHVHLNIHVKPGKKVRINDIIINGNEEVDELTLQRKMKDTKEKTMFNPGGLKSDDRDSTRFNPIRTLGNLSISSIGNWANDKLRFRLFKWSKYNPDKYKEDKKNIVTHYNSLGYRDAIILSDSIEKLDDENINIHLNISEGSKYYFRNIVWEGNSKYSAERLADRLGIKKGDVYNQTRLEQKLFLDITTGDVSSLYMDQGYLFFNLRPEEVLIEGDSIDLVIYVYEGPQAIIRKVIIKGNTKTAEHVIRRELRTRPGDYFSRADLIRSQREIAALNLFDPEQIGINPVPNVADGTVDIEYTVVEKPSDQIELSAGWGGAIGGLYGTAGIVFNNFAIRNLFTPARWQPLPAGDGQQLSLRVQANGAFFQSYTFSFAEPWLGGKKPNAFSVSTNYTLYNRSGLPRSDANVSYILTRSISTSYGKRMNWPDNYFQASAAVNFQNYYLRNYPGFVIDNGHANNFYVKGTLARYSAGDNPQFPTHGSNITLSAQFTPPYSLLDKSIVSKPEDERYQWIEYHKWKFNAEWYTRILGPMKSGARKLILKTSVKMGFLGYYNKDLGLSTFELFRMGGDGLTNLQGFTLVGYDILSLRGTEDEFEPIGAPPGTLSGNIFNKYTVELRYPFSTNPAATIFGLIFAEGGNTYLGFKNYDPFKLKRSVGFGLRVYLPMFGLLGFDYGIGFDNPGTSGLSFGDLLGRGAFHFKIGFEPE